MFSHVSVGVGDFDRALRFYRPVMAALGFGERFADPSEPLAAWGGAADRPHFLILHPLDGGTARPGRGAMVAFDAPDRTAVDDAHTAALAHGGTDEGAPGPRPHYHADYYGAYVRDPDGNKLAFACHASASRPSPRE